MKSTIYILTVLLSSFLVQAQEEMLIGQLADRLVVRENYDENGVFRNKQTFQAGGLIETDGYYEIEVETEFFDENGNLTDKYSTTYRCRPEASSVMVMAFPFSNRNSKETEINTSSKNFKDLYNMDSLKNVELEISFDSGLLDFFGSKSKIYIFDRKLNHKTKDIQINSKLTVKAYTWGIRIKELEYSVLEKISKKGLLSYQKFVENDGSYFTIIYK